MAEHESQIQYFIRKLEKNDGSCLKLKQCYMGDVGCVVWDAAIALAKYLETKQFIDTSKDLNAWAGKKVVELGAGTGAVGLMAATLGAHVFVTDLEELGTLLNLNIQENLDLVNKGSITAKVLKWGEDVSDFMPHPHYILMADCIYYEQSVVPLVETLKLLAGPETCIICCYEQRTEGINPKIEERFFEFLKQSFSIEEIPLDQQDPDFSCPEIHILHIRKKLE
ncbi:protein N-lysine methyltransferase METTL21D [Eucyclogobius newberryi]|uniref:protein N-lysine methyltransferase METTL21D n=1 Tax=Eucyclogobius newberryi TaxID=166745 RepID=UPI003B5B9B0B